jgi:malignant T-cell-amplified sequence
MMPRIQVDAGAIKFVLGGANVMCPGITSGGGAMPVELPEGAPVSVYAEGKQHALAIGTLVMSTADIRAKNKGIGIEVLHHLDDQLWHVRSFA